MRRLFFKWWGTESLCFLSNSGDNFLGMSLYETGTAFLILIFGVTLSIILLLGEFYNPVRKTRQFTSKPMRSTNITSSNTRESNSMDDQSEIRDLGRSLSTNFYSSYKKSSNEYFNYDSELSHSFHRKIKELY
jgi:hypothetical protein